jgi:hypothetical protein
MFGGYSDTRSWPSISLDRNEHRTGAMRVFHTLGSVVTRVPRRSRAPRPAAPTGRYAVPRSAAGGVGTAGCTRPSAEHRDRTTTGPALVPHRHVGRARERQAAGGRAAWATPRTGGRRYSLGESDRPTWKQLHCRRLGRRLIAFSILLPTVCAFSRFLPDASRLSLRQTHRS